MRSSNGASRATRLTVVTEHHERGVRVRLHGTADVTTLQDLLAALAEVSLDGQRNVQIDVSNLDFIDVPALRRLVAFAAEARQSRHVVTTRGARPLLRRMTRVLEVDDDLALS